MDKLQEAMSWERVVNMSNDVISSICDIIYYPEIYPNISKHVIQE